MCITSFLFGEPHHDTVLMKGVAGVDEAGRGCVIGPLVVAGVLFNENDAASLKDMGVRDSKALTSTKRESLADEISELAIQVEYFELSPKSIDSVVFRSVPLRRLNYLETMVMACVIRRLHPSKSYVDTCDVDNHRCREQILSVLPFSTEIICEPKADIKYPATSAASILAKVRRDSIIKDLRDEYGDFNSGYPSDNKTQMFLREWYRENGEIPHFARHSWSTVRRIKDEFRTPEQ